MNIDSQPFFKPWVPNKFNGTLILAESCPKGRQTDGITGWKAIPDEMWPQDFILQHVKEKREQDDATFKSIRSSFLYNEQVLNSFEFWERHAFSNLIPRLIESENTRPTKDDKENIKIQFELIFKAVSPKRILLTSAWAVEVLKYLSDTKGKYEKIGDNDWWEMRFNNILTIGIYHPASWNRYKYNVNRARLATARLWNDKKAVY